MAFPVIEVDSTAGSPSDTDASGAGPATAINDTTEGTTASYAGSGPYTITFSGATDLSGVSADGSHVLLLHTSTGRKFFTIEAVDDGADTVDVTEAPAGTTSGLSWAIGGTRASLLNSDDSRTLLGDLLAGWTVELQDGHTETSNGFNADYTSLGQNGNNTDGPIKICAASGAATRPEVTIEYTHTSGTYYVFTGGGNFWWFEGFTFNIKKSSTGSARLFSLSHAIVVKNMIIDDTGSTGGAWLISYEYGAAGNGYRWEGNYIYAPNGSYIYSRAASWSFVGNIVDGGTYGLYCLFSREGTIAYNVFKNCDNEGLYLAGNYMYGHSIVHNVFDNNGRDGIRVVSTADSFYNVAAFIANNLFTNNAGYGLNFNGATQANFDNAKPFIVGNVAGLGADANTSGACNMTGVFDDSENFSINPSPDSSLYEDYANDDWRVIAAAQSKGFPFAASALSEHFSSNMKSWTDPGIVQIEPPSGSTVIIQRPRRVM